MLRNIEANLINLNTVVRSMYGSMIEFRAEVKNDINSLREDLNVMNDSVSNLSVCLQEHKEQTETELADLQTALDSAETNFTSQLAQLLTSLDSIQANHTCLLNNHNRLVNIKMDSLEECLSEHKEQVTGKLNALQTSQANHSSQLEKIQDCVTYLKIIHGPYTCGGTGGWRRVAYLDMTDPSTTCPSGWNMTGYSKRTCGRAIDGTNTCDSATFPVGGEYNKICGKIRAYQWATTDGFHRIPSTLVAIIDNAYIDGVSVTHGTPRNHIWTFVAGITERNPTSVNSCPCDASINISVPSFVANDYFCESGVNGRWESSKHHTFNSNDALWDGEDCLPSSTCCSRRNPPYFVKQLPTTTTDDIEARICLDEPSSNEDIAVELVELYVQ